MKAVLRHLWMWSWLVTGPIAVLFVTWAWNLATDYRDFQLRYDVGAGRFGLLAEGNSSARQLLRSTRVKLQPRRPMEGVRTIALFVPEANLRALDDDLPHSGYDYVQGALWNGSDFQKVEVRYRGDFFYHWARPKTSWRVKTRKKQLFEGMRRFNLIAPKSASQLNNYLGYRLAHLMGLLAPKVEMVEVVVNGESRGLHLLVEQLEELTLRNNGRMPGDLYVGELVTRDAYTGVLNAVFDHPRLWEKVAVNNHFDEASFAPMEALCALVNGFSNEATHHALGQLFDLEAFGKLGAFESLIQFQHASPRHNWRLYYDPWRCHFEPVVWDTDAWWNHEQLGDRPPLSLDPNATRLHNLLLQNATWLRARHDALLEFFASGTDERFLAELDAAITVVRRNLSLDRRLYPPDEDAVLASLAGLRRYVQWSFDEVARASLYEPEPVLYDVRDGTIGVRVAGRRPVEAVTLEFFGDVPAGIAVELVTRRYGTERRVDVTGRVATQGNVLQIDVPLTAQLVNEPRRERGLAVQNHVVAPATYRFALDGLPAGLPLADLVVTRADGTREVAREVDALQEVGLDHVYGVAEPVPTAEPLVWSGVRRIEAVEEIERDVVVLPGTRVELLPGASLILRGRLTALGTREEPITFGPAVANGAPWGTVALVGRGCDGSRLAHVSFADGSGWVDPAGLFEYSAMLSVHDVQGVELRRCDFRDSHVVDDMVHGVYAGIDFFGCTFARAPADALDLDMSTGIIEGCSFEDCGNDGIDFMTSDCVLVDSTFARCGDKGVSVGEGSTLLAVDLAITDCLIGAQVKDGSVVATRHVEFDGNGTALDAYKKNWRYDAGGTAIVDRCTFTGNDVLATADAHSRIDIHDSFVEIVPEAVAGVQLHADVDALDTERAAGRELQPMPAAIRARQDRTAHHWWRADPGRRGRLEGRRPGE